MKSQKLRNKLKIYDILDRAENEKIGHRSFHLRVMSFDDN